MVMIVGKIPDCRQMTGRTKMVPPIIAFIKATTVRAGV